MVVVVIEEILKSCLPQGIKNMNSFSVADNGCEMFLSCRSQSYHLIWILFIGLDIK